MDPPVSSNSSGGVSREELLSKVSEWSLGCDNALLNRMKDFSEDLVKSSQEIKDSCDSLLNDVDLLEFQVSNVTNQFLMLSNTQFVENCVQEFQEYNLKEEKRQEQPVPTKAEKEAVLIGQMKEAIRLGLDISREREQSRLNAAEDSFSASTESRFSSSVNLAHLIGSSKFFSSRFCGLLSEDRLTRGTCINSRASSATSGSTNTEENDKVTNPQHTACVKSFMENREFDGNQSTHVPSVEVAPVSLPAANSNVTSHADYPKVLPTGSDFKPKIVGEPHKPSNIFFPVPPRPPSSTSTSSNSLFEDDNPPLNEPNIFDAPKANSRPRSVTPPDVRPPPIMDLSDSEEEFFNPIPSNEPSFSSLFGNQPRQVIAPIPQSEPPPQPGHQPQLVPHRIVQPQSPFGLQQNLPESVATNPSSKSQLNSPSPSAPTQTAPRLDPYKVDTVSTTRTPNNQADEKQERNVRTPPEFVTPVISSSSSHSRGEAKINSVIANDNVNVRNNEVSREVSSRQPEPSVQPPPKRMSIFDSSDSDDDLFSNFSAKGFKKKTLFKSSPPKYPADTNSTKGIATIERRPPPILDISDNSDEDIFKSFSSKSKSSSVLDHLPHQPVKEHIQDNSEHSNSFSPTSQSIPTGQMSEQTEQSPKPVLPQANAVDSFLSSKSERTRAVASESAFHPQKNAKRDHDINHISEETENGNKFSAVDDKSGLQNESLFKTEVVATVYDPKHTGPNNFLYENKEPPPLSEEEEDGDLFTSHMDRLKTPPRYVEEKERNAFTGHLNSEPSIDTVIPPTLKPQHKEKFKSIFDSSDSDDDLFSSKFKTKSTPTLREISPQPNLSKPYSNEPRFPVLDKSELRPPPILDMSDSSDDDIFKPLSKPKSSTTTSIVNILEPNKIQIVSPSKIRTSPAVMIPAAVTSDILNSSATTKASFVHKAPDAEYVPTPQEIPSSSDDSKKPAVVIAENFKSSEELKATVNCPTKVATTPASDVPLPISNLETPVMQTPVKSSDNDDGNENISATTKEPSVAAAKVKVPSPKLKMKTKKEVSIFESSDSDDDLFSSIKSKPKASVSVKAEVNHMPPITVPKAGPKKTPALAKATKSLFSDSDDENDDLFGTGKNESKVSLVVSSLPDETPEEDESDRVTLPLPPKSDVIKKEGSEKTNSLEKRFGAVTKSLESIFSAKNLTLARSTTSAIMPCTPPDVVSFEDQVSTENLLHCITRDRPKISHPRRPPSLRKQVSRSSNSLLMPNSEEMDPFV